MTNNNPHANKQDHLAGDEGATLREKLWRLRGTVGHRKPAGQDHPDCGMLPRRLTAVWWPRGELLIPDSGRLGTLIALHWRDFFMRLRFPLPAIAVQRHLGSSYPLGSMTAAERCLLGLRILSPCSRRRRAALVAVGLR